MLVRTLWNRVTISIWQHWIPYSVFEKYFMRLPYKSLDLGWFACFRIQFLPDHIMIHSCLVCVSECWGGRTGRRRRTRGYRTKNKNLTRQCGEQKRLKHTIKHTAVFSHLQSTVATYNRWDWARVHSTTWRLLQVVACWLQIGLARTHKLLRACRLSGAWNFCGGECVCRCS